MRQLAGQGLSALAANGPPGFDFREVTERVAHALTSGDEPSVNSRSYVASFDTRGLQFSPKQPARGGAASEAVVKTLAISRGNRGIDAADERGEWVVLGNTIQRSLSHDKRVIEHYEARADGVSVTWVLPQPLPGSGSLTVEARVDGLAYAGSTQNGFHFADDAGVARMRVGNATAVDSTGRKWELAMQSSGNSLRVDVPETILADATYPLAIDPTVSAEFGTDNPVYMEADGTQSLPGVAFGGTNYFVVWADNRFSSSSIVGTRVSTNGVVGDPAGLILTTTANVNEYISVASVNGSFLVVWNDTRNSATTGDDIFGSRITAAGVVLDTNGFSIIAASGDQRMPRVAANGNDYYVAWWDRRADTGDIYGTKVSAGGTVSNPGGTPICTATGGQYESVVAANGANFMVAWNDGRNDPGFGDIYAARVDSSGTVLDPDGFLVAAALHGQFKPVIAPLGADYLIAWEDQRNSTTNAEDIYAARVTASGTVLDPGGFAVVNPPAMDQFAPAVASVGNQCWIVWADTRNQALPSSTDIYGARDDANGLVDTTSVPVCTALKAQGSVGLASSGSGLFLVWVDNRNAGYVFNSIFGARMNAAGVLDEPNGFPVSLSPNVELIPDVAFNGTNYLLVWEDYRNFTNGNSSTDLYGTRMTAAGAVLDPNGIAIATGTNVQYNPAVAALNGNWFVAWQDYRFTASAYDIYGTRVSAGGVVMEPAGILVCSNADYQVDPRVTANNTNWFVVWADARDYAVANHNYDLYGARINAAGTVLDPGGFPISTEIKDQTNPWNGWDGNNFLVTWSDMRNSGINQIYASRVAPNGAVLDPAGIQISPTSTAQVDSTIAFNGTNYLIAWKDSRSNALSGADIYAARLTPAGTVLDANGFVVCSASGDQLEPVAASIGGGDFLVAWEDARSLSTNGYDIYAARVTGAGTCPDTNGFAVNVSGRNQIYPKIATGAGDVLVVNSSFRLSEGANRIAGNFVSFATTTAPHIETIFNVPNAPKIVWTATSGSTYRLQFKTNLSDPNWADVMPDVTASGAFATNMDNTGAAARRFYRVLQISP